MRNFHISFIILFSSICIYYQSYYDALKLTAYFQYQKQSYLFKRINSYLTPYESAVYLGNKKKLKKREKNIYQNLGLMHLLTPSGLHLASLMIFLRYLKKFKLIGLLISSFFIIFVNNFFSLKRILTYKLLKTHLKFPSNTTFYLSFLFDILLQNFSRSPLSSLYSFAFWGIVLFEKKIGHRLILFFFIQSLISISLGKENILINFFLTPLFSFLFMFCYPIELICRFFFNIDLFEYYTSILKGTYNFIAASPSVGIFNLFLIILITNIKAFFSLNNKKFYFSIFLFNATHLN